MIQLAEIFQDGMTLQCQKNIKIWGKTDSPQKIKVYINDVLVTEEFEADGDFSILIPSQKPVYDATIKLQGTLDTIKLKRVDFGEVWIAGGQSNMEFHLRYDAEGDVEIAAANDEHLRFYDVGEYSFPEEKEQGRKDAAGWDKWIPFQPEWAEHFSATGVYFAKQLRKHLNIPVAIVGCNWGGTTASTWMDESYLEADKDLKSYLSDYQEATRELDLKEYIQINESHLDIISSDFFKENDQKILKGTIGPEDYEKAAEIGKMMAAHPNPMGPRHPNAPGCLYRMMVKKIAGFANRGVIWYQGESDDHKAEIYDKLFTAMIRCWRDIWGEELPFLFVQLAPFGDWMGITGDKYPLLRQKQEFVSKNVPNTYMTSIMDSGMEHDIHPKHKRPVGERLALLARGKIYGEEIYCESPEFINANVKDGMIELEFAHCETGLTVEEEHISAFEVILNDEPIRGKIEIADNTVKVYHHMIKNDSKVECRFAWKGYCKVNLYNREGLPVKPFYWKNT